MKNFVGIIYLCIVLFTNGCASTGGTDNLINASDMVVIEIRNSSISCVPLERLQQADNQDYQRIIFLPINFGGIYIIRSKIPNFSELEKFSIISIWYISPRNSNPILQRFDITGKFDRDTDPVVVARREQDREAAEVARIQNEEREAERQQPRFSPEGQEYVKKTLIQAVGEANNSTNRGRTLFFESTVSIEQGTMAGQWRVREMFNQSGIIFMEFFDTIPLRVARGNATILYRVEISNLGVIKYTIDSFR